MTMVGNLCGDHRLAQPAVGGERDPVCGMAVDPATAKEHRDYAGVTHYSAPTEATSGSTPIQTAI